MKTELRNGLVRLYAATLTYLGQASNYFGQKTGLRMLKSAFHPSELAVASYLDRVKYVVEGIMKLVDLVQAEALHVVHDKLRL